MHHCRFAVPAAAAPSAAAAASHHPCCPVAAAAPVAACRRGCGSAPGGGDGGGGIPDIYDCEKNTLLEDGVMFPALVVICTLLVLSCGCSFIILSFPVINQ